MRVCDGWPWSGTFLHDRVHVDSCRPIYRARCQAPLLSPSCATVPRHAHAHAHARTTTAKATCCLIRVLILYARAVFPTVPGVQYLKKCRNAMRENKDLKASGSHLDLIRAPCVLYGVEYIDPVTLASYRPKPKSHAMRWRKLLSMLRYIIYIQ